MAATISPTLFCSAQTAPAPEVRPTDPLQGPVHEYRIGPGDELSITFPYNSEINRDGPVGPDGQFTLPLIGSMPLAGKTIPEATALISEALRRAEIVENAYPSITIRRYGTNIYVGGQVKLPGSLQLTAGMDVMQAIIAVGGLLDSAKGKVAIIRRSTDNRPVVTLVDVKGYSQGRSGAKVELLRPQDVVFVPKSSIAEVDQWIDNYINKVLPFSRGVNYNVGNNANVVSR